MRHQINIKAVDIPARLQAYDRRLAAIHEAGHVIMAVHLGYDAEAWIHPSSTDDALGEKTWLGHMIMHNLPIEHGHPHTRMVAVAGMVAETLWKNGHDEEYGEPYGWENNLMDAESMSYSDWQLSSCEPGEADEELYDLTAKVASLFMAELWPVIVGTSRTLMLNSELICEFRVSPAEMQAA